MTSQVLSDGSCTALEDKELPRELEAAQTPAEQSWAAGMRGRGGEPALLDVVSSTLPTPTQPLSLGSSEAPRASPNLASGWVFSLQSVGLVLWGSSLSFPAVPACLPCLAPWFPSQEGGLVAAGHCLCSNVSLGLSQACLCSSSLSGFTNGAQACELPHQRGEAPAQGLTISLV